MAKSKNNPNLLKELENAGSKAESKRSGFLEDEEILFSKSDSKDDEDLGPKSDNKKASKVAKKPAPKEQRRSAKRGALSLEEFIEDCVEYKTSTAQSYNVDREIIGKLSQIASYLNITKLSLASNILQNWIDDNYEELKAYVQKQREQNDFL